MESVPSDTSVNQKPMRLHIKDDKNSQYLTKKLTIGCWQYIIQVEGQPGLTEWCWHWDGEC